jgi:AcrR family transcriptional regulator
MELPLRRWQEGRTDVVSSTTETGVAPGTRPRPSAARDRILATANQLFFSTGIRAVGVDRVIAESQIARMTFFRHFPSKDDLVVAFLAGRVEGARAEVAELRASAGADWPRAVLGWVLEGVATARAVEDFRGCEFVNTAAEFCDPTHPVRVVVAEHRAWIRSLLQDALVELGHPVPFGTAEMLLALRTGAVIAASLEGLDDPDGALTSTWWSLIDAKSATTSST